MDKCIAVTLFLALLAGSAMPAKGQATNLSGEWEVELTAPTGNYHLKASILQEGEKLSGSVTGEIRSARLQGTIHGRHFNAVSQIEVNGKLILTTFTGELDGDSMRGTADFEGFPGYWTSKRVTSPSKAIEKAALTGQKTGVTGTWKLEVKTAAGNQLSNLHFQAGRREGHRTVQSIVRRSACHR